MLPRTPVRSRRATRIGRARPADQGMALIPSEVGLITTLAAATAIVLKRTRADWLIVAAAAAIILLATTLLSAGIIYAGAVSLSGLERTLADAPVADVNVEVSGHLAADELRSVDANVRERLAAGLGRIGAGVVRQTESDSFSLPGQRPDADRIDLAVFGTYEALAAHARLTEGAWPVAGGGSAVEVALSAATATQLGLSVGDQLTLASRVEQGFEVPVRVVGVFELNDPTDPYWWDSPLLLEGQVESDTYRTFGPFVTDAATFLSRVAHPNLVARWHALPAFGNLRIDDVGDFGASVAGMRGEIAGALGGSRRLVVTTRLDEILARAERSLLVARSGVLILTVQLAVLAGYALLLTAGLLVEQRRIETALLRSRGAGTGQVATLALVEGALLAVPAAALGPWLASSSLRVLNGVGPLAEIGLELRPQVTAAAYLLAAAAAAACMVALVVPAFTSARSFIATRQARGRSDSRGVAQRVGLDLALLLVAAVGFWQLRHYGATITSSVQGRIGLDPFLVAAPAVGLLAGAVLALRLIPLLAQLIDHAVSGTRGLVSSLGAWQLSRRPLRYTRSSLLLMLAIALGVFAVAYTGTWSSSQADQADYHVGADVTVQPDRRAGTSLPSSLLASAYRDMDGVRSVMPASRRDMRVSRTTGSGTLVALDAAAAPDVLRVRPDLSPTPVAALMRRLAEARPSLDVPQLTGTPRRLRLDLGLDIQLDPATAPPGFFVDVSGAAVVRDASGMIFRVGGASVPRGATTAQLVIPLARALPDGTVVGPDYPLQLLAIEVRISTLDNVRRTSSFVVRDLAGSASLTGDDWAPIALDRSSGAWHSIVTPRAGGPIAADDLALPDAVGMHFAVNGGGRPIEPPFTFSIQASQVSTTAIRALPIVAAGNFLDATASRVGGQTSVDLGSGREPASIVGAMTAFPTTDPGQPVAIADLPTLALLDYQLTGSLSDPPEWWLSVSPERADAVTSALGDRPFTSRSVSSRIDRAEALRTDPVALGVIGALSLGFVAAALFAAIGFVVSASVSASERLTEFALLRALGLSPSQLSGWLGLENGLLVLISLVGGTGLGLLMSWVALPFVTVTQDATRAVPDVIVHIPWATIGALEAITVLVLGAMVLVLAAVLRRIGLGTALRLGDE